MHSVKEYMIWADHWFAVQSLKQGKKLQKRIFVATDEPEVIAEMNKYANSYCF